MANLSLKDLVSRYNEANEKAKKRRDEIERRRKREEAEEAKRLKKLQDERFNLLGEVVSQTGFTEKYPGDLGVGNFPLLIGIILDGMENLKQNDAHFDRYMKRYEAFAAQQEASAEVVTEAAE